MPSSLYVRSRWKLTLGIGSANDRFVPRSNALDRTSTQITTSIAVQPFPRIESMLMLPMANS